MNLGKVQLKGFLFERSNRSVLDILYTFHSQKGRGENSTKVTILILLSAKNKLYPLKLMPERFHLNGHTAVSRPNGDLLY